MTDRKAFIITLRDGSIERMARLIDVGLIHYEAGPKDLDRATMLAFLYWLKERVERKQESGK